MIDIVPSSPLSICSNQPGTRSQGEYGVERKIDLSARTAASVSRRLHFAGDQSVGNSLRSRCGKLAGKRIADGGEN